MVVLLDAAPAWQWYTTMVVCHSAIGVMCAVWAAAHNETHACWYIICDDFASKYNEGVYWIVTYCEDCTWYSTVLHNWEDVPARLELCVICMHLHKMTQYRWCCGRLPTRWGCASPWLWQRLYFSSFLMGTTASKCGTAWRQWHNVHVVILVVVLCTTESWHALEDWSLYKVLYRNTMMWKEARGRWMPINSIKKILTRKKFTEN